jgi:hypothetical protein
VVWSAAAWTPLWLITAFVSESASTRGTLQGNIQKEKIWLGGRDSNPDTQLQRLQSYRWTTSQFKAGQRILRHPGTTAPQNGLFFNISAQN